MRSKKKTMTKVLVCLSQTALAAAGLSACGRAQSIGSGGSTADRGAGDTGAAVEREGAFAEKVFSNTILDWSSDEGEVEVSLAESEAILNIINGNAPTAAVRTSTVAFFGNGGICSGTLIGPHHVLTAKHCAPNAKAAGRYIGFGDNAKNATAREVVSIRLPTSSEDSALVTFRGDIPQGYAPAPLVSGDTKLEKGRKVIIAGYGQTSVKTSGSAGRLYQGEMEYVSTRTGGQKTIALVSSSQTSLCFGDSGGPTYLDMGGKMHLLGVTSNGPSTCDSANVVDVRQIAAWVAQAGDDELRAHLSGQSVPKAPGGAAGMPEPAPTVPPADQATPAMPAPAPQAPSPSAPKADCTVGSDSSLQACLGAGPITAETARACSRGYFERLKACRSEGLPKGQSPGVPGTGGAPSGQPGAPAHSKSSKTSTSGGPQGSPSQGQTQQEQDQAASDAQARAQKAIDAAKAKAAQPR